MPLLTRLQVSSDMVRYMDRAVGQEKHSFLVDDPSFADDFAPNGELPDRSDLRVGGKLTRLQARS